MLAAEVVQRLLTVDDEAERHDLLKATLANVNVEEFLRALKSEAERQWTISPHASLRMAEALINSAEVAEQPTHRALGLMAKADALGFLGRYPESLVLSDLAADAFRDADDQVGWARTRIGWLYTKQLAGEGEQALVTAQHAEDILVEHREWLRAAGLATNAAVVCYKLARLRESVQLYDRALEYLNRAALSDGPLSATIGVRTGWATANKANALALLGEFGTAMKLHDESLQLFVRHSDTVSVIQQQHNIARVYLGQGRYTRALRLMVDAIADADQAGLSNVGAAIMLDAIECHLRLNRSAEALDLAEEAVRRFQQCGTPTEVARARFYSAQALARLGDLSNAHRLLDQVAQVFTDTNLQGELGLALLLRANLKLVDAPSSAALPDLERAQKVFTACGLVVRQAQAKLATARLQLALDQPWAASNTAHEALETTRTLGVPWLAHESHHILASVAQQSGDLAEALAHYDAAIRSIERMQGGLTTDLRSNFLADKLQVYRDAINYCLSSGHLTTAFEYLERAKSRALVDYLGQNIDVRVRSANPESQELLDEIAHLREEHNWFYSRLYDPALSNQVGHGASDREIAHLRAEITDRERRIARLHERLTLQQADDGEAPWPLHTERSQDLPPLSSTDVLLEYYIADQTISVFVVTNGGFTVVPLDITASDLRALVARWHLGLSAMAESISAGTNTSSLSRHLVRLLEIVHAKLLAPVAHLLVDRERLVVVPHGPLHLVPFHAAFDGNTHVLERMEVSVSPSSAVLRLCNERPRRPATSAAVIGHSNGGQLPHVLDEARAVSALLPGVTYLEEEATRDAVIRSVPHHGVLHLASHADARLDNPAFAHLRLADGQLMTADVFNLELDGALVCLSACETGKSFVAAGDELVGLSRAFLFAGATSLIQSLWRVEDGSTSDLMVRFYGGLAAGQSRAAALRQAQLAARESSAGNPYSWAPFQLVGHAG